MSRNVKVAAVQAAPVFLDRDATIEKSCDLIAKASAEGASLVVFPEAFVPTYPDWVWRTVPWERDEWFELLWDQAVVIPSEASERLAEAAAQHGAHVVMGINERDENGSTLYNSLLYFSPTGGLIGKHRKLIPTGGERLVWGMGDGSTLDVFPTAIGRLGGLICWENYMPLARYALYSQGIDIYVAPTWDNSDAWVPTLRHIAKEGRVFVIGVTACQRAADVPGTLRGRDDVYGDEDDWMSKGNSAIVDPWGALLAGPLVGSEGIVTAELDLDSLPRARMEFDPVGHYSRPDVFTFGVDRGTS